MFIGHRCTECRHPDVWGERQPHPVLGLTGGLPDNCGQKCHPRCVWNPQPEAMTRYDKAGQPVTDILPPGSEAPWLTARSTHDCAACRDLYTQLTAERTTTP